MTQQEAITAIETGHIAEGLMAMAIYSGAKNISALEGLYEKKINDQWLIKCNGHDQEIGNVPEFSWYIEFNGWPAGILTLFGEGELCAGEAANEESLRKALIEFVKNN